MKKKHFLSGFFLLVMVLFSVGYALEPDVTEIKTFMWRLDYQGKSSNILGSVHFLKKDMYPLPEPIEEAFARSEFLVVEADISADKMSRHLVITMEKGMYKGEENLKQNLSDKTYRMAESVLEKSGLDISFYQKFKPWFLALTISGLELMKMGYDPNFGVDKYFIDRVAGKGGDTGSIPEKILELEGIPFQINLFDGFSKEENDRFLFYSLQEIFQYRKEIDHLVQAWKQGDAARMEQLLDMNMKQNSELGSIYKIFVVDRNIAMADKIFNFIKTGKVYFIVVGAAHLIGPQGILRLLEQKGVSLSQI